MMRERIQWIIVVGLASILTSFGGESVRADGTLKSEIQRQVNLILSAMRDATDIALGEFTCGSTAEFNGHIGPGLRAAYEEALLAAGCVLNDKADHLLSGQYFTTNMSALQAGKPLRLTIKTALTKRDGEAPVTLLDIGAPIDSKHFATINSTQDLARAIGFTGHISPQDTSAAKRQAEMARQIATPQPRIEGTRVRGGPASEYAVEVRRRPGGDQGAFTPVTPAVEDGVLIAPVGLNDEYELGIYNRSKLPVAVSVTIDGLNVFYFADKANRDEKGEPRFTHFIVQPEGAIVDGKTADGSSTIPGWFQKLAPPNNYLTFLVTEHGKGAISKVGAKPRDKVGAIHVQFSHCLPLRDGERPKSGAETGLGVPRSIEQQAVRFQIDPPHEFLTLRYDRAKP